MKAGNYIENQITSQIAIITVVSHVEFTHYNAVIVNPQNSSIYLYKDWSSIDVFIKALKRDGWTKKKIKFELQGAL